MQVQPLKKVYTESPRPREERFDLIFLDRTRRRQLLLRPRFPRDPEESLLWRKELQESMLGRESASDSSSQSHSMVGKEGVVSSKLRTKSSFASLLPWRLARRPSLAINDLRLECSRAFVAGRRVVEVATIFMKYLIYRRVSGQGDCWDVDDHPSCLIYERYNVLLCCFFLLCLLGFLWGTKNNRFSAKKVE